jgi:4,4'-diaponeurosporenoate glycosyltransferase
MPANPTAGIRGGERRRNGIVHLDWGTALLALTWLAGWLLFLRLPRLPSAVAGVRPAVSVVIPARDEADGLPSVLAGLDRQAAAADEVIVVDDHSSDATAAVAAAAGARVLPAPPLPAGWTGKAWACAHGATAARGDVLVFLDADTEPGPDLLARLTTAVQQRGGLVSAVPYHRMQRAYERLSAFFSAIAVMGIGAASARPDAPVTGAFGPCLACTRADYDTAGGHAGVRAAVVDDVALARRFRAARLPVFVAGGREAVRYRLYPNGLRELVEGWSKNFAAGAGSTPPTRFLLVMAWVIGCGTAAQVPFRSLMAALADWSYPGVVGWVVYAAFGVQLAVMLRPLGNYSWAAPLFPVPLAAWFVIFFRSIWWMARGEVRWKGRVVPVRAR